MERDQHLRLHTDRRRAASFGDDPEEYDRTRPTYPDALVDALLADGGRHVLDVGCGTGIVARLFAARGCDVVGLEPDGRMAAVARGHGVEVVDGTVETWDPAGRTFDLLTAGQAWHWVEPHQGAARAAVLLHSGGRFGFFWNQAFPADSVRPVMEEVYARHAPELADRSVLLGRRDPALYDAVADVMRAEGSFVAVDVRTFGHDVEYGVSQWIALARTHSDHHTLPPEQLERLVDDLGPSLQRAGGRVPVHYEATLVTGRRR